MSEVNVCPWWIGYFLISPLRKIMQNPNKILSPYIKQGNTVLDIGSGMGYFSLEMCKLVGDNGKVYCVDLQEKMLNNLIKRAKKRNLDHRIETIQNELTTLKLDHLKETFDFALVFAVVHEVGDTQKFFRELYDALKPNAKVLIAEPKGHVKYDNFLSSMEIAKKRGFKLLSEPNIKKCFSMLLCK